METFSALLALCAGNSPVPVNSPHKGQWRGALMFTLICARINDWVNNREAGDLRRHLDHYDVSVMVDLTTAIASIGNSCFRRRSKNTSKLRVTGLCEGNSPVTDEYPEKGPVTRKMFPFDDAIMVEGSATTRFVMSIFINRHPLCIFLPEWTLCIIAAHSCNEQNFYVYLYGE